MDSLLLYFFTGLQAPEGSVIMPVGWLATAGTILTGAIGTLFFMLIRTKDQAAKELQAEKEKRLSDAIEHERLVSELKEKIARMKGGGHADRPS